MKKLILPCLLLLALAAGVAFFLTRHSAQRRMAPAELVPGNAMAYLEVTDFRRTRERWMHTALRELWLEPEVQSFLAQPLAKLPQLAAWSRTMAQIDQLQPRQAFAALLSMEGNSPRFVAGLAYSGDRAALEGLLAEPRATFHQAYPAGKSDLVLYHQAEIQTFTAGDYVLAEATREGWYFVSDDLAALQALLDRFAQKTLDPKGSLAADDTFRGTLQPLPTDAEALGFVRMEPLVQQLTTLVAATGQTLDEATLAAWKHRRGLGFSTRMEGSDFKDSFFVYAPGSTVEEKLPMSSLALTSPETMAYYDTALSGGVLAQVLSLAKATGRDFSAATPLLHQLGPELSLALDWPATAEVNALLAIPVNPRAEGLPATLDKISEGLGWTRQEEEGSAFWRGQPLLPGAEGVYPAMTVSKGFLFAGPHAALAATVKKPAGPGLATAPAWQSVLKTAPAPAGTFLFLNTAALADRIYGTARPAVAMALAFNPATMPYLDASKLPSAPALTRHLGATGLLRSTTAEGQLLVSQGPVTLPQLTLLLGGAGVAAFPLLRDNLPPGLLPPGLLSLPGISAPATPAGPH